jgi:hypothetical protein
MAEPGLSELITVAQRYRDKPMSDNVLESTALSLKLQEKGKVKLLGGGRNISMPLSYQQNSTYKRYTGDELLDISKTTVLTSAEYEWKQIALAITFSGLEVDVQVTGKEAEFNLVEERLDVAESTFQNEFSTDIYSDGSADGGKQIGGLQLIVADTPTNTVGGINGSTSAFWRNFSFDATTDGGAAVTSANIAQYMDEVYVNTCRGNDKVDLIVADNNYFIAFLQNMRSRQIVQDASGKLAAAGFSTLRYMNAEVVLDGGYGGDAPTNHMYFLNTKHLGLRVAKKRNMAILPDRNSVNQDATVKLMAWAGNLCCSNRFLQGVLKD